MPMGMLSQSQERGTERVKERGPGSTQLVSPHSLFPPQEMFLSAAAEWVRVQTQVKLRYFYPPTGSLNVASALIRFEYSHGDDSFPFVRVSISASVG